MTGIHMLTLRVPFAVMEAVWAKVARGEVNAYIVALIRKDMAKKKGAKRDASHNRRPPERDSGGS